MSTISSSPDVVEVLDAPFSTSTPYSLLVGQTARGTLANSLDQDVYKVNLVAGQTYTFALIGTGQNYLTDPILYLYDSQGINIIDQDDGSGPGLSSSLVRTVFQTGVYYLDVYSVGVSSGQYGLSFTSGTTASFDLSMAAAAEHSALTATELNQWGSIGAPVTLTYGFRDSGIAKDNVGNPSQFSKLNSIEISAVREILGIWSDVCNITFQEVNPGGYTNNATILLGNYNSTLDGAGAYAIRPTTGNVSTISTEGDVWLNISPRGVSTSSINHGSYSFYTILHEVGHALGLSHPGDYNAAPGVSITYNGYAKFIQDSQQFSVMSYFEGSNTGESPGTQGTAYTLLMSDIYEMQLLYGVNYTTRSTDTTYGFSNNTGSSVYGFTQGVSPYICIWDGGGIDTLNCSGFTQNQSIDLHSASFSNVGGGISNVSIAYLAVIENATGGSGNDALVGNDVANILVGGAGDDTLDGGNGNDMLFGGAGNDTFNSDLASRGGNDTMYGGAGDDVYFLLSNSDSVVELTGEGTDTILVDFTYSLALLPNVECLVLYGSSNINATGNSAINALFGNSGNNILTGGGGNDVFLFNASGNGIDTISDLSTGDIIEILGANFTGSSTSGNGSSVGLNKIECSRSGGITTLCIGTDAILGVDVRILLTGNYAPDQFVASSQNITLGAHTNVAPTGIVTITGTATQGQTLTASNTLADIDGLGTITYQWKADGTNIANATSATYTLTQAQVGKAITVVASYQDLLGANESVASIATSLVANTNDLPTGSVTITGTATQGQTLTASNTLADIDGLGTIGYTWTRISANVEQLGAPVNLHTGSSYTLTDADVGRLIYVTATYIDGQGAPETVVSGFTSAIAAPATTYNTPISSIQSIGLSPDGQSLLIRVGDTTQSVPLGSSISFNGTNVTTTELTNTITPVKAFTDNANNSYKLPTAYSGPVGFLQYQLFDNSDGAVITAPLGTNDFIYLSSTNTAANKATNGNGGQDVIAGGVGSSFIAGGTNHNSTFFLDGRASGVSWSTITDFNIGTDNLTIFGWNPNNSSLNTTNPIINGAVGFTGLTLYMNNLAPDGSAAKYVNPALNQITLANHTLAEFGYNSVAALNTALQTLSTEAINNAGPDIIASHTASNGHFTVGQTTDNVGTGIHWYLNVH